MMQITDKTKCCGCSACYNTCPQKCIEMKLDEEGFSYPEVNIGQCINCGACEQVCPINYHHSSIKKNDRRAYVIQLNEVNELKEAASGGFFMALAKWVIDQGGEVVGAAFDDSFSVVHRKSGSLNECKAFLGSKYVQSDLNTVFIEVKRTLQDGKICLFSGTPCQIEGLRCFLNKEYTRLITVDLVCAGVPSPKLWKEYLDWQCRKYKSSIIYFNFRNKTFGYKSSTVKIKFANGRTYSKSGRVDPMMRWFVSGLSKRPACYACVFKGINRNSDFTIFDAWHAKHLAGIKDNDCGYTTVVLHSTKAYEIFDLLSKYLKSYEINLDDAIKFDGIMINNQPTKPENREAFFLKLIKDGFVECYNLYGKITTGDKIIEYLKPIIYKLGLIKMAKYCKKRLKKLK